MILDTSILIDAERRRVSLDAILANADVAIAAITAAELLVGVETAIARYRKARAAFVEEVLMLLPIETYSLDIARAHARLIAAAAHAGRPRGNHDLMIAATAVARGRIVITMDKTGFQDLPGVISRSP